MSKLTPLTGQKLLRKRVIEAALLDAAGPAKWNEEDAYLLAEQPAAIGAALVKEVHKHLETSRIGWLFRQKLSTGGGKVTLAKASRVSAKLKFFAALDFLVEVNWDAWMRLTPEQRVALVDHELCHFGVEYDDKTGDKRFVLIHHDLEEFSAIIRRWGLWKEDVAAFSSAVREQLDFLQAVR